MTNWYDTLTDNVSAVNAAMWNAMTGTLKSRPMTLMADSANQPSTDYAALGMSTAKFPVTWGIFQGGTDRTVERLCWYTPMDNNWDGGNISLQIEWTSTGASTDTVAWQLRGLRMDDGELFSGHVTPVTVVTQTDDVIGDGYKQLTAQSTAFAITGVGKTILWEIVRDSTGDTSPDDAYLIGLKMLYTASTT